MIGNRKNNNEQEEGNATRICENNGSEIAVFFTLHISHGHEILLPLLQNLRKRVVHKNAIVVDAWLLTYSIVIE